MKTSVINSKSVHVWIDLKQGLLEAVWHRDITEEDWEAAYMIMSELALEHGIELYLLDMRDGQMTPELEERIEEYRKPYLSLWEAGIKHYAALARDQKQIDKREATWRRLMPSGANIRFFLEENEAREWLRSQKKSR